MGNKRERGPCENCIALSRVSGLLTLEPLLRIILILICDILTAREGAHMIKPKRPSPRPLTTELDEVSELISTLQARAAALEHALRGIDTAHYVVQQSVYDDKVELSDTREELSTALARYEQLTAAIAAEQAQKGRAERDTIVQSFQCLDNELASAYARSQSLLKRRAELAQEAEARLAEWPEHWQEVRARFIPLNTDVTRAIEACLSYREALSKVDMQSGEVSPIYAALNNFRDGYSLFHERDLKNELRRIREQPRHI